MFQVLRAQSGSTLARCMQAIKVKFEEIHPDSYSIGDIDLKLARLEKKTEDSLQARAQGIEKKIEDVNLERKQKAGAVGDELQAKIGALVGITMEELNSKLDRVIENVGGVEGMSTGRNGNLTSRAEIEEKVKELVKPTKDAIEQVKEIQNSWISRLSSLESRTSEVNQIFSNIDGEISQLKK